MDNTISCSTARFAMVAFFTTIEDEPIMELCAPTLEECGRVPNIGEHVFLSSYAHDRMNDKRPLFRDAYRVVDVITHYTENKGYNKIAVQYSVILQKEDK